MEPFVVDEYEKPVLVDNETEIVNIPTIKLIVKSSENESATDLWVPTDSVFLVRLTNFRLFFQSSLKSFQMQLKHILSLEDVKRLLGFKTNKLVIHMHTEPKYIEMSFSQYKDVFMEKLTQQLDKKSWV